MAFESAVLAFERDGSELGYTISRPIGGESGAPLVVLHGWGSSRSDWIRVVEAFAADPRTAHRAVLTLDMPGHGDSKVGAGDTTIAAFVDNVDAVMAAEGLSAAVAIGHSLGGVMALELAVRHPDRVAQVVGVDTYHYLQVYPKQSEEDVETFAGGFMIDLDTSIRNLVEMSSTPGTPEAVKEHVRGSTHRAASQPKVVELLVDGLRWDLDAALQYLSQRPLSVPVTAIVSAVLLSPAAAEQFSGRIPFTLYPDRGHYLPMEDPGLTARMIADEL